MKKIVTTRNSVIVITILLVIVIGFLVLGENDTSVNKASKEVAEAPATPEKQSNNRKEDGSLSSQRSDQTHSVFTPHPANKEVNDFWRGLKNSGIRSIPLTVTERFVNDEPLPEGTTFTLDLFDNFTVEATVTRSIKNVNGTISTTARIAGSKWGRVFLSQTEKQVRAKITLPEKNQMFGIHFNQVDSLHYLLELDPSLEEIDDIGPHPVTPEDSERPRMIDEIPAEELLANQDLPVPLSDESEAATVVDVLVAYTNDALTEAGNVAEMNNIIGIGIEMANDANTTTDTGIILNLVYSENTDHTSSGSRSTALSRVTSTADGYMDEVHTSRDLYGADFVSLIIGGTSGGIAWLLTSSSGSSSYAFSVVGLSSYDSYTPVHEIGHNMGLAHAYDQDYQWGPTEGSIGTDAAGWHWHPTPGETGFCSVMTYTGGSYFDGVPPDGEPSPPAHAATDGLGHVRVGIFSDPDIDHGSPSLPTGDAAYGNNARVLRALKEVYGGYRSRPIDPNSILVEYPNESTILTGQESYKIRWNSNNISGNVKIDLYQNGSLHQVVAANTFNDRVYEWNVPSNLSGTNFKIRVSSVDDDSLYDESDNNFSINEKFYSENLDTEPTGYTIAGGWENGCQQQVITLALRNQTQGRIFMIPTLMVWLHPPVHSLLWLLIAAIIPISISNFPVGLPCMMGIKPRCRYLMIIPHGTISIQKKEDSTLTPGRILILIFPPMPTGNPLYTYDGFMKILAGVAIMPVCRSTILYSQGEPK